MTPRPQIDAAVLAGGRGVRMGGPKASLRLGDERLVDRAVRIASSRFRRTFVVRGDPGDPPIPDLAVPQVPDRLPGLGALGGVHGALSAASGDGVVLLPVDVPLMHPDLLVLLAERLEGADAVVPRSASGLQPLVAAYARRCLPVVEAALRAGERQVLAFYDQIDLRVLDLRRELRWRDREELFTNVNTPADLERVRAVVRMARR